MPFDPKAAARFIVTAHREKAAYANLPTDIAPANVVEAYAVQDALADMWQATEGPIAGLKIATTTRVMQELNSRVDLDNDTPEQAAKAYLQQFGLIAP